MEEQETEKHGFSIMYFALLILIVLLWLYGIDYTIDSGISKAHSSALTGAAIIALVVETYLAYRLVKFVGNKII